MATQPISFPLIMVVSSDFSSTDRVLEQQMSWATKFLGRGLASLFV